MGGTAAYLLEQNVSSISDVDKLREFAKDLQDFAKREEEKNTALQTRIKDQENSIVESFLNSNKEPIWVMAEEDSPEPDDKGIYFDGKDFEVMPAKDLSSTFSTCLSQ